ncbi:sugar ABC transporter ATP-binding protein [Massilia sp. Root351]|jgi:lipopolysaccharide transport system ATP-binding protein|uniref:ABC transporter ATP-binding protein n=1 Tax=Massilia sp. Root351 TaxID=1736522 RepID=UPI0007107176|nr:ABC transporter ATP-binding protein [Massilia sp. Root351]KQV88700.1 sugar ABC transporter ATP-binding protein [Massilia sp. Root351]
MSSLHVHQLGKAYKQYHSRWGRLAEWLLPFRGARHREKWVIQGVSFALAPGEAVGIVGVNGAGKSTLLKLITGTVTPTTGSVTISGRVAALLELGMGFHPDFTGRQNTFMAGQLLGMTVPEITALMPEIEAFAGIGDYMDQPVRVYSSGMQMRLAFSVATARRPDVLIVDEALSVGDAYFQHKSFERIREFRRLGTTLLIVSHDRAAMQSICDRAILLDGGRLARQGTPEEVMDYYNALLAERDGSRVQQLAAPEGRVQTTSGTGEAHVLDVTLRNEQDQVQELFNVGVPAQLCVRVAVHAPVPRLVLGYMIKDRLGHEVFGTNTHHLGMPVLDLVPGQTLEYRFHFPLNLGPGSYSVTTALTANETHLAHNYEWRDLAALFIVTNMNRREFIGSSWLEPRVEILQ